MILFFICLAFLLTGLYACLLFYIVKRWKQDIKKVMPLECNDYPFLTILIPARNEAFNLPACINSVLNQDYPHDRMEIIVIDDHSTDGTLGVVKAIKDKRLRLLQLEQFLPKNNVIIAFKKVALNLGINHARGAYIITTDADCIAPKLWLKTYAAAFNTGKEMALAAVKIENKKGLLTAFQDLDVAGTMLLTAGAVFAKHPILSNGANFGFSKKTFDALGGYEGNENQASGDDIFLLQKAIRKDVEKIVFLSTSQALVQTTAVKTWGALFWQRLRWAGKTSAYRDPYLIGFQVFVFLFNFLLWGLLILSLSTCLLAPSVVLFIWLIKLCADFIYLQFAVKQVGNQSSLLWFLPAFFTHSLYIVGIGILALLPISSQWKGRKTK